MTDSYDNQIMIMLMVSGIFFFPLCRFVFCCQSTVNNLLQPLSEFYLPIIADSYVIPAKHILGLLADFQLFPQVPDFKYIYTIIDMVVQFQFRLRTFK